MVYETGEGDVRGCFTVEDILQPSCYPEKVFALPFTGAATFRVRGGVALRVLGSAEQPHQLFVFAWDEIRERRAKFVSDRADGRGRGEQVSLTLL